MFWATFERKSVAQKLSKIAQAGHTGWNPDDGKLQIFTSQKVDLRRGLMKQ